MQKFTTKISHLLLSSALMLAHTYAMDTKYFDDDSDVYSGSEASMSADEAMTLDKLSKGDLKDLLKQLIGAPEKEISPIEMLRTNMQTHIPYVYKIAFGSSLTGESGGHTGTGFLFNAQDGIILTNYHVVPGDDFGIITLTDDKGNEYTETDVEILSTSAGRQFGDFTFLRVKRLATDDPKAQITLARTFDIKKHDHLGFVGNTYGNLDIETGQVNEVCTYWDSEETMGSMSFSVNLKARGGASGSPVFNVNGTVVGILFAGDEIHNMIYPMPFVLEAYEQLKSGHKITAKTLGAPLMPEKIQDLARFHQIPIDQLRQYLTEGNDAQENQLMVAKPFIPGKDKETSLQPEDIVLTIDGENVTPNQIRINQLLNNGDEHVVEVFRLGELKTLTVKTVTYTQEFSKSIDVNGTTVVSADSSLLERYGIKPGAPLLKTGGLEMLGISDSFSIVSRVHKTQVSTFNDFVKAVHDTYATDKISTFMLWVSDPHGTGIQTVNMDLRGAMGKSFCVTQMNDSEHRWENIDYKDYVATNFPQEELATNNDLRQQAKKRGIGENKKAPPVKRKRKY